MRRPWKKNDHLIHMHFFNPFVSTLKILTRGVFGDSLFSLNISHSRLTIPAEVTKSSSSIVRFKHWQRVWNSPCPNSRQQNIARYEWQVLSYIAHSEDFASSDLASVCFPPCYAYCLVNISKNWKISKHRMKNVIVLIRWKKYLDKW